MNTIIVIKGDVIIRLEDESGPHMTRCVTRMISRNTWDRVGPAASVEIIIIMVIN